MAGHSKWANIKHRKSRSDAKKGKLFSKILKEIYSAVRQGGTDPKSNSRLRLALHKARTANVPNETVQRSLKRAEDSNIEMYDVSYEVYGYGGVGIVCCCSTENRNRAASFVRGTLSSKGGTLASPNSVLFNFSRKGLIVLSREGIDFDEIFLLMSERGAEDVLEEENSILVIVPPDQLGFFVEYLIDKGAHLSSFDLTWVPNSEVECSQEHETLNHKIIDSLEAIEDIYEVFSNMKCSSQSDSFLS
ncbi:YebC/PmpR family DNA-binding transcriptional regulator [Candidatus Similichlamydia epinepheli]|uniref:YebC/PmpR family DNA-binding transcriptional regulator n=1 Tax=Candidatus Similichlamydia epinepheli TaxID=1903953 RepID=UPI000D33CEC0|nr:YebC/PmpR family DNA-binding transcriptional regulator [Candidatus Similichlamydia epinepheli]